MKIKEYYKYRIVDNPAFGRIRCYRCGKRLKSVIYIAHDENDTEFIFGPKCIKIVLKTHSLMEAIDDEI